jgi:hypothetical protein
MKALKIPHYFLMAMAILVFNSACSNTTSPDTDIPNTTAVHIALTGTPVLMIYDYDTDSHLLSTTVTLTETAGIETTINSIDFKFLKDNAVRESRSLSGGSLSANGKLNLEVQMLISGQHDSLRIEVGGSNIDNQRITSSKIVDIEYVPNLAGTYKGPVKGELGGQEFETTMIFQITQEGKILKGPWAQEQNGLSGIFAGNIISNEFTAELEMITPCSGLIDAKAEIQSHGFSIKGSYKGTTYCIGDIEAEFTVERVAIK